MFTFSKIGIREKVVSVRFDVFSQLGYSIQKIASKAKDGTQSGRNKISTVKSRSTDLGRSGKASIA